MKRSTARTALVTMAAGLTALTLSLSGCSAPAEGGDGAAETGDGSLQQILDRGVLKVGLCLSAPPWGFINEKGAPDGFDPTVAQLLADDLGVTLETVEVNAASRVPSLQTGQVDVISCTFTITPERQQQVAFSNTLVYNGQSLLVKKGSGIETIADLAGKRVAVAKGATNGQITTDVAPEAIQQAYDTTNTEILALQQGQVDAVVESSSVVTAAAEKDPSLVVAIDGEFGPKSSYALGIALGNESLLERVNEFVKKFHEDRVGEELYEKWFGTVPTYQFKGLG